MLTMDLPLQASHEPFRPLNYKALAESIKTRRRHEEANLKMMKEGMHLCALSLSVLMGELC